MITSKVWHRDEYLEMRRTNLEALAEADEGNTNAGPVDHPCDGAHIGEPTEHFGGSRRDAHVGQKAELWKAGDISEVVKSADGTDERGQDKGGPRSTISVGLVCVRKT